MKVMICDGCGKKIDGIEQYLGCDLCLDCRSRINGFVLAWDEYNHLKNVPLFKQIPDFEEYLNKGDLLGHGFIGHYLEIGGSLDELESGKIKMYNRTFAVSVEKN